MLVELVLDAGDDDISGFEVFLTIEVLRCFREVSFAQSTTKIAMARFFFEVAQVHPRR